MSETWGRRHLSFHIPNSTFGIRIIPHSHQSAIRNPKSAMESFRISKSAIRNQITPHSTSPQSEIRNPKSAIRNKKGPARTTGPQLQKWS
jgi:hypothetical protein